MSLGTSGAISAAIGGDDNTFNINESNNAGDPSFAVGNNRINPGENLIITQVGNSLFQEIEIDLDGNGGQAFQAGETLTIRIFYNDGTVQDVPFVGPQASVSVSSINGVPDLAGIQIVMGTGDIKVNGISIDDGDISPPAALFVDKTITDIGGDGSLGTADEVGDVITYQIIAGNTGGTDVNDFSISDPLLSDLTFVDSNQSDDTILENGEFVTYTGSYTVTQDDLDSRGQSADGMTGDDFIDNIVTVTGNDGSGDITLMDQEEAPLLYNPDLEVIKTATDVDGVLGGTADEAGDVISYEIVVDNTGNISLTNVTVTDPLLDGTNGTGLTLVANGNGDSTGQTHLNLIILI